MPCSVKRSWRQLWKFFLATPKNWEMNLPALSNTFCWTLRRCLVAPLTIHLASLGGSRYEHVVAPHSCLHEMKLHIFTWGNTGSSSCCFHYPRFFWLKLAIYTVILRTKDIIHNWWSCRVVEDTHVTHGLYIAYMIYVYFAWFIRWIVMNEAKVSLHFK